MTYLSYIVARQRFAIVGSKGWFEQTKKHRDSHYCNTTCTRPFQRLHVWHRTLDGANSGREWHSPMCCKGLELKLSVKPRVFNQPQDFTKVDNTHRRFSRKELIFFSFVSGRTGGTPSHVGTYSSRKPPKNRLRSTNKVMFNYKRMPHSGTLSNCGYNAVL